MKIAFFDFDGTLMRHDSFIKFAKFSVGKKALIFSLMKSVPILILWKLGFKNNSEAKQTLFSHLYRGISYSRFKEFCQAYVSSIDSDIRPEIIMIKNNHKSEGHKVIIVSASIGDWIRPWARCNGVDDVIATEVEVDNFGNLTGRFSTPNCHGAEKATRIKKSLPAIEDFETWAYGDSSGDNAMLALVTHPNKV